MPINYYIEQISKENVIQETEPKVVLYIEGYKSMFK